MRQNKTVICLFTLLIFLSSAIIAQQIQVYQLSTQFRQLNELQQWLYDNYGVSSIEELKTKLTQQTEEQYRGNPFVTSLYPGQLQAENITGMHWYTYLGGSLYNRTDTLAFPEQSASFIIFGKDTNGDGVYDVIYAKNTTSGQIQYGGAWDAGEVDGANASAVIQEAINALTSGGVIIFKSGEYSLTSKILINAKSIILRGSGYDTVIKPPSGDYAFEFNANGDWSKHIIFEDLKFEADALQDAIRLIDCHRPTINRCYFSKCNIVAESVEYWTEGYSEFNVMHDHCGVCFKKTGGTGSFSDTTLFHSHFDNLESGEYGIKVNGGYVYRSYFYLVGVISGGYLFHITSGYIRGSRMLLVLDGNSGTYFKIDTTDNCQGNDILLMNIPPSGATLIDDVNNVIFGAISLSHNEVWRRYDTIPIGVNDSYGDEKTFMRYHLTRMPRMRIIIGGSFASGETITVKVSAVYAHTVKTIEKSFTSTSDYELTLSDLHDLMDIYDGINPLEIRVCAKTNQSSTNVTITFHIYL